MRMVSMGVALLTVGVGVCTAQDSTSQPTSSRPVLELGENVTMRLALIPAGQFTMGSPADEIGRSENAYMTEGPMHSVTFIKPFYMGIHEVTQAQWTQVMRTDVADQRDKVDRSWRLYGVGDNYAMYYVSWYDAVEFCSELSQTVGRTVRLPTEAEWEYACRAGTATPFNTGKTITPGQANYLASYVYGKGKVTDQKPRKVMPVGSFAPNAWGLYDMHANVEEWCMDWYDRAYYASLGDNSISPQGPSSSPYNCRILRGGRWDGPPEQARSAYRKYSNPKRSHYGIGFRVVVETEEDQSSTPRSKGNLTMVVMTTVSSVFSLNTHPLVVRIQGPVFKTYRKEKVSTATPVNVQFNGIPQGKYKVVIEYGSRELERVIEVGDNTVITDMVMY